ncbi:MAG: hypothetical protein QXK53_07410 [Nitrososphaerota archaeon]
MEVESAVSALASDERDRKALLRDAEKIFGAVEPELAIKGQGPAHYPDGSCPR